MTKVPKTLPELNSGTGQEIGRVMNLWGSQYHECRIRQHGLIDAVNRIFDANTQ